MGFQNWGEGKWGWLKTNPSFFEGGPELSPVGTATQLPPSFQVAKFSFLGSEEEPGMIFDWVDVERKGRLSLEEFSSGLRMSVPGGCLGTCRIARRPLHCAQHRARLG